MFLFLALGAGAASFVSAATEELTDCCYWSQKILYRFKIVVIVLIFRTIFESLKEFLTLFKLGRWTEPFNTFYATILYLMR